jgi:hypothetical protein
MSQLREFLLASAHFRPVRPNLPQLNAVEVDNQELALEYLSIERELDEETLSLQTTPTLEEDWDRRVKEAMQEEMTIEDIQVKDFVQHDHQSLNAVVRSHTDASIDLIMEALRQTAGQDDAKRHNTSKKLRAIRTGLTDHRDHVELQMRLCRAVSQMAQQRGTSFLN